MTTILLRGSVLLAALTFFCLALSAQPGRGHHPPRPFHAIEQHQEALGITEAQQAELEELKASFREEARALRAQEMEPDAKREAMHSLMEGLKADLESILTEAQVAQLEALRKEHMQKRRKQFKEARSAVQSYLDQNVKPVMLEQRQKLEADITGEDRAELNRLRTAVAAQKAARKAAKENGERPQRPAKGERPEREAIKQLVEKYDTEIEALFAEVETEAAQWQSDISFIMNAHRPEAAPKHGPSHSRKGKGMGKNHRGQGAEHPGARIFHKARFLLMDPAEEAAAQPQALIQSARAFPNPASNQITLQYELQQDSEVTLQLHTREGQLQQEYEQGQLSAGSQQTRIDLGQLRDGAYYLSILAGGEVQIVPFVVGRQ